MPQQYKDQHGFLIEIVKIGEEVIRKLTCGLPGMTIRRRAAEKPQSIQ